MDFVEWCDLVLNKTIEANRLVTTPHVLGTYYWQLATLLFGKEIADPKTFQTTTYCKAMEDAGRTLQITGLEMSGKVTKAGRDHAKNPFPLWWDICQEPLDPEYAQILHVVNRLSPRIASDHVWLEWVDHQTLVTELGWHQDTHLVRSVANDLMDWRLVYTMHHPGSSEVSLQATYPGLVWEIRRGLTVESKFIDDLIAEWETTSVEFKQYLYVSSVEQKAEFIKDILSLANTQASGRRWLIIGFSNKTHGYANTPNPLTQDHLERILAEYTDPAVEIRYEVVSYRKGPVGKLEVLRDPKKVSYRVAKSLGDKLKGDKKQIFKGQILVRHGSQVEEPTPGEEQLLLEEGERARSQQQL